jgi:hypothetical protein
MISSIVTLIGISLVETPFHYILSLLRILLYNYIINRFVFSFTLFFSYKGMFRDYPDLYNSSNNFQLTLSIYLTFSDCRMM